ncbi:MAG: helix-loop-helix domain-containing protein [Methanobacteriota archaeon]|nr:MAG: helix-loop-helix domain-containing protein [Euryarchaeota archaeon]
MLHRALACGYARTITLLAAAPRTGTSRFRPPPRMNAPRGALDDSSPYSAPLLPWAATDMSAPTTSEAARHRHNATEQRRAARINTAVESLRSLLKVGYIRVRLARCGGGRIEALLQPAGARWRGHVSSLRPRPGWQTENRPQPLGRRSHIAQAVRLLHTGAVHQTITPAAGCCTQGCPLARAAGVHV